MGEDDPDYVPILNKADDPHGALTFRTDQGIYFTGLRRDRLLFSGLIVPNFS